MIRQRHPLQHRLDTAPTTVASAAGKLSVRLMLPAGSVHALVRMASADCHMPNKELINKQFEKDKKQDLLLWRRHLDQCCLLSALVCRTMRESLNHWLGFAAAACIHKSSACNQSCCLMRASRVCTSMVNDSQGRRNHPTHLDIPSAGFLKNGRIDDADGVQARIR